MSGVDLVNKNAFNQMPKLPASNFNLPNSITFLRIVLIPVFIWVFSQPTPERAFWSVVIFLGAALTDFLDGYLARKSGQVTNLGKLLDPVADKLLVASGLILLVQFQRVSVWLAIVLIARELIVTGARMVAAREGLVVAADGTGKIKVVAQISGIVCLVAIGIVESMDHWLLEIGNMMLYLALGFSLWSAWGYLSGIAKKIGPQW
ncbi:MAG: CDP-diacylglycerol--glycerol-3-phosphate 3-phosphatidyltransferase [Nitrospira sp.]|nr:CDP-diacylglycerol--glycerol-3-phosphate 3-phosphatidyltransferase [Nitrospira sp.]MCA9477421.1 CDP-diacylglycerol--glycerol-3-phosphate 3-phosphatidyltransferase [Nitrospira sp.]MCA9481255.1 CDP-diacylglycerol--glycerol-3-phosphate 3-phosphatidyltransferase [Nitrospira sp.]MDR4488371.1 CDP-diacylglycerol--glycerol-3-phosphate 3-phosphatidyltransferase [Nitrospirales bacterium]